MGRRPRRRRRSPRTIPRRADQQDPPRGRRPRAADAIILTPGQSGDNPQLLPLLDQVAVRRDGPGRPRKRPEQVLADKAYSHPSTRAALRRRGIGFTSPEKTDQIARRAAKGSRGGRPPAFDPQLSAERNVVERCFNGSSSSGPWPPATRSGWPTTGRRSSLRRLCCGYVLADRTRPTWSREPQPSCAPPDHDPSLL